MSKPFDATLNALIDLRASQWADCFARVAGMPVGPSTPIDTDLATSLQADRVFRIDASKPYVLHLELEANPRLGIPAELLRYNAMIDVRHKLPVETVLILLRPKALASDMTGRYQRVGVTGKPISEFHYHVERVWERPMEFWQERGVALEAAFSLVTDEAGRKLERNVQRFRERLKDSGVDETTEKTLINSSYFMCGLRYNRGVVDEIYRRLNMLLEESTTYQGVLQKGERKGKAKGRIEGARRILLQLGAERFGKPSREVLRSLRAIKDADQLDRLAVRLLHVKSWDELLADK
jgi:hypothetical protein